jgi:hypothetical protein
MYLEKCLPTIRIPTRHFEKQNAGISFSEMQGIVCQNCPIYWPGKVEPSIIKHMPIVKHFSIFFTHSLTKLSDFCVIGRAN